MSWSKSNPYRIQIPNNKIIPFPHSSLSNPHIIELTHSLIPTFSHFHIPQLSHSQIIKLPHYRITTLSHYQIIKFTQAATSIAADNQKQYEIMSNRKAIVQNNLGLFNSLYEQLTEILRVGKILYKANDAAKAQEYNFTAMKKKVRAAAKQADITNPNPATT